MVTHFVLSMIDPQILFFVQGLRTYMLTEFFTSLTALGSLPFMIVLVIGIWWAKKRDDAVLTGIAIVSAGIIVKVLKPLIARARPETIPHLIYHGIDSYSFPSGHATMAFTVATVLAYRIPRLRGFVYGMAVLVACSRVYLGVHYATDILAGALLGGLVGSMILRYQEPILQTVKRVHSY